MNCFIQEIVILGKSGEKRSVSLKPGLNIVTGDSKTGKSALIEIVDYCLCSKTSNIPQGVVSQFAQMFILVLNFGSKLLVIGRNNFYNDKSGRIYVIVETKQSVIDDISLKYFDEHVMLQLKDGQEQIERHLNMSVVNISESDDVEPSKKRKASLREMPAFLFQHQNLLANKHALFFHFDDYYKRQAVIDSFPIFSGWVDDDYFSLRRELESLERELRKTEIDQKKQQLALKEVEAELNGHFRNYFRLVGMPFNENQRLAELFALRKNLPDYSSKSFLSQEILDEYNNLKIDREKLGVRLNEVTRHIKDLEESERYANEFQVGLKTLDIKSTQATSEEKIYTCPTCGKITEELSQELVRLQEARKSLTTELNQLGSYAISYKKEVETMKVEQANIRKQLRQVNVRIEEIERINEEITADANISNRVLFAKAQIDLRVEMLEKQNRVVIVSESSELHDRIRLLREELRKINVQKYFEDAEKFFNANMNKIANKLDFEDELKPISFKLDLSTFSFWHQDKVLGKVTLNEMGSGANWLTCHLSVFLTFLHHFAIQPKSVIPPFLFLDQPSQVYFPRNFNEGDNRDNDIKQVEKVYISILEEISEIEKEVGFKPQVIVTDHADNLDLGNYIFEDYVRKRWTPASDRALI
jgi:hypothetical protein